MPNKLGGEKDSIGQVAPTTQTIARNQARQQFQSLSQNQVSENDRFSANYAHAMSKATRNIISNMVGNRNK